MVSVAGQIAGPVLVSVMVGGTGGVGIGNTNPISVVGGVKGEVRIAIGVAVAGAIGVEIAVEDQIK